jgi:hemolysin-activating ACP:hemolysin acyltransferase
MAFLFQQMEQWDRSWITDWVCRFGHTPRLRSFSQAVFADARFGILNRNGNERGRQVKVIR